MEPNTQIVQELAGIRAALEGILARMTPAEERDRVETVAGYVRSANNGGDLVWLYGAHPKLQYRVAVVYVEDFPLLAGLLDPTVGKVFDGEVAPSKATAASKGYLVACAPFEAYLTPTGRRTDNDQMIFKFSAARALVAPGAPAAPAKPAEAATSAPTGAPDDAGQAEFENLVSASDTLKQAGRAVRSKLGKMAAGYNGAGKGLADTEQRERAFNNLRSLCGNSEEKRHLVVRYLFGKASLTELTAGECQAIRDWVRVARAGAGADWLPSETAVADLKAILVAAALPEA